MNGEAFGITHIGKMAEQLQTFDKLPACIHAALMPNPKMEPAPLGKYFWRAHDQDALQTGILDPAGPGCFSRTRYGLRVLHMSFDA